VKSQSGFRAIDLLACHADEKLLGGQTRHQDRPQVGANAKLTGAKE